jgi:hypothetical protein
MFNNPDTFTDNQKELIKINPLLFITETNLPLAS